MAPAPSAAGGAAGSLDVADVAGAELAFGVCPLLELPELRVASAASRGWRCSAAACAADAAARGVGAFATGGVFTEALTEDSLDLCTLTARSTWFDFQEFSMGLLVTASRLDQVLERTLQALAGLPRCIRHYVRLPPADGLQAAAEWITWPAASACRGACGPLLSARALRRLWSSAFVSLDPSTNAHARCLAQSLLERWRALWYCGHLAGSATVSCLNMNYFQGNEIRGGEEWKVQALALGLPCGTFAGVSISYYDEDKHFVR